MFCSTRAISDHSVAVASQPVIPQLLSSNEVHKYVKEQREIINNFRSQPWPMQMKMAALMYVITLFNKSKIINT